MKIFMAHNAYQSAGGEDVVASMEARLLRQRGEEVIWYERHNDEIGPEHRSRLATAMKAVWAWDSYREIRHILGRERPDVAHFHNIFPLISPAAYFACADAGVPVIQTLHNYRLVCLSGNLLRNGHVCEECLGRRVPWPGVLHRCYRRGTLASSAVATMLVAHRWLRSWESKVDCYIAVSQFAREKLISAGLSGKTIYVKPNFVHPDPGPRKPARGAYALFVGRLSEEKGVRVLMDAWTRLQTDVPLLIVGEGPMRNEMTRIAERLSSKNVKFLGQVPHHEVSSILQGAQFLVFPSLWYEGFPVTLVEALACGLPAITSELGAMSEIVVNARTGLLFMAGNSYDLAAKVEWAWAHPEQMAAMGSNARAVYESKFTAERNYVALLGIYQKAIESAQNRKSPR